MVEVVSDREIQMTRRGRDLGVLKSQLRPHKGEELRWNL